MGSGHSHALPESSNEQILWIALSLTSTFLIAETIARIFQNSLALLANAAHMFTDAAALAGVQIAKRHGVLAPNAKLRSQVVPEPEFIDQNSNGKAAKEGDARASDEPSEPSRKFARCKRISWAKLLKRVFAIEMEQCPNCGGKLKSIAAILEQALI